MRTTGFMISAILCTTALGCGAGWTARTCASNADGNCRASDTAQPHTRPTTDLTDVLVQEPACKNGMGEVDVYVHGGDMQLTTYCLVDSSESAFTLSPAAGSTPALAPGPAPSPASSTPVCGPNATGLCVDRCHPYPHTAKSTVGLADISVTEPACKNGMGEVDLHAQNRDELQLTVYCLINTPAPVALAGGR